MSLLVVVAAVAVAVAVEAGVAVEADVEASNEFKLFDSSSFHLNFQKRSSGHRWISHKCKIG